MCPYLYIIICTYVPHFLEKSLSFLHYGPNIKATQHYIGRRLFRKGEEMWYVGIINAAILHSAHILFFSGNSVQCQAEQRKSQCKGETCTTKLSLLHAYYVIYCNPPHSLSHNLVKIFNLALIFWLYDNVHNNYYACVNQLQNTLKSKFQFDLCKLTRHLTCTYVILDICDLRKLVLVVSVQLEGFAGENFGE